MVCKQTSTGSLLESLELLIIPNCCCCLEQVSQLVISRLIGLLEELEQQQVQPEDWILQEARNIRGILENQTFRLASVPPT